MKTINKFFTITGFLLIITFSYNVNSYCLVTDENSIKFINSATAFSVGNNGTILKTINGGMTWEQKLSGVNADLYSVDFINNEIGIAVGENGTAIMTTNGGEYWKIKYTGTNERLNSIKMSAPPYGQLSDKINCIACGNNGLILVSHNSAKSWNIVSTNIISNLTSVFFTDMLYGFTAGESGAFLFTVNGGDNWQVRDLGIGLRNLYSVCMTSRMNGTIVGEAGFIINTSDGWNTCTIPSSLLYENNLYDIKYLDNYNAVAVGDNGIIIRTSNAGNTWELKNSSPANLRSVGIPTNDGITVGASGTKYYTNDGGITWSSYKVIPSKNTSKNNGTINGFSLAQNYPNPFNPATVIRYSLSVSGNVILKIYDILGNEAAVLVNENQKPGTYETQWNAGNYPSGIYYYKLTTQDFSETRKMILVK